VVPVLWTTAHTGTVIQPQATPFRLFLRYFQPLATPGAVCSVARVVSILNIDRKPKVAPGIGPARLETGRFAAANCENLKPSRNCRYMTPPPEVFRSGTMPYGSAGRPVRYSMTLRTKRGPVACCFWLWPGLCFINGVSVGMIRFYAYANYPF